MTELFAAGGGTGNRWLAWIFFAMLVVSAILAFTTWWGNRERDP